MRAPAIDAQSSKRPAGPVAGALMALAAVLLAAPASAEPEKQVAPDPSLSTPIHRIPMYGPEGDAVTADDEEPAALSQKVTCNKCHDYSKIERGWHFNACDPNVPPGRPGQAWVLTDVASGTQIPVSGRGWKGTYTPKEIGLSSWQFVDAFGRHAPGGGLGERFADAYASVEDRWLATGYLEINCLGCHNADFNQNQDEWAKNVVRGNYVEAGTAAAEIAHVTGFVNRLGPMFDRIMGEAPDNPQFLPRVEYYDTIFKPKNEVFFDVSTQMPNTRCYYCHTNHPVAKDEWQVTEDVHMARGFRCTDCHRNDITHDITRNYEGESELSRPFTCRGCHLGSDDDAQAAMRKAGFGAAPRPEHEGIPRIHFEDLSCTACHSGLMPGQTPQQMQTSRIHALGYHGVAYDPNAQPTVQEPVFLELDGRITPHRMVFPAFFGKRADGKVTPMLPKDVVAGTGGMLAAPKNKLPKPPKPAEVAAALKKLGEGAVYVGGGRLHELGSDGKLTSSEHDAAMPYAWPLAHNVRPAAQSLGVDAACTDCHATDSAFLFGKVPAVGPVHIGEPVTMSMASFHGEDATYHSLFAWTFIFRPWLKIFGFLVVGVVTLLLAAYALPAIRTGLGKAVGRREG